MIIVNKDKNTIVNINNVVCIGMDDNKTVISSFAPETKVILGRYEDKEVTQTVFNQIIEAMEQCEEIFYMPE